MAALPPHFLWPHHKLHVKSETFRKFLKTFRNYIFRVRHLERSLKHLKHLETTCIRVRHLQRFLKHLKHLIHWKHLFITC